MCYGCGVGCSQLVASQEGVGRASQHCYIPSFIAFSRADTGSILPFTLGSGSATLKGGDESCEVQCPRPLCQTTQGGTKAHPSHSAVAVEAGISACLASGVSGYASGGPGFLWLPLEHEDGAAKSPGHLPMVLLGPLQHNGNGRDCSPALTAWAEQAETWFRGC